MATENTPQQTGKPKVIIIDRKFKPEDLRIPRNQSYVRDLGQCFKIYQKWGYDIIWVDTGIDAMKALRTYLKDVKSIIVEAHVPGGGLTIARLIRFRPECRQIPVFLMSQQMIDSDIKAAKHLGVIDVMLRPFKEIQVLEERLKKNSALYGQIAAETAKIDPKTHIVRELEKITNLPAMPTVYNQIQELSHDPDSTTEEYSEIIELDPAITAQMLRLCNSSAFSFSRKITNVGDAVNLLGLQTVIDFVRTLSVVGAFKGKATAFDSVNFWKHCIAVGVVTKLLAENPELGGKLKIKGEDPFLAGMVHDIGKQVLGHFFNDMFIMVLEEMKSGKTMFDCENDVLGITHENVGEGLALKWQLPDNLIQIIGHHHTPLLDSPDMVHLVHISDVFCKCNGYSFGERSKEFTYSENTLKRLGIDQDGLNAKVKEMENSVRTQVNDTFSAIFS